MNDEELLRRVESLKDTMVAVSTGGPRIDNVNPDYQMEYSEVDRELRTRSIPNPNPYSDLWQWYGRWSSGDLPSYSSRRVFLAELFAPVLDQLRARVTGRGGEPPAPTGWTRVDRTVGEARMRLAEAASEEQFQGIGLLCREVLVSLAQAVYVPDRHPPLDGIQPSDSDAKRMLEAYLAVELGGGANEEARAHAKSALRLAVALQHRRTADFRQAAMCVEASAAVVNIVAITSGRRDPEQNVLAS
jgi:hypothetical protein